MEKNCRGVRKGTWTGEEDSLLRECVEKYGEGKWHLVPFRAGLNRCRKSCRLRWLNYLRPNIKRSCFTKDEVDLMKRLHKLLGNKWSLIAGRLPGRTANDVKNFWNTHIEKKRLVITPSGGGVSRGGLKGLSHHHQKPINQSNIARPRPRTFSKLVHIPWPRNNATITNDISNRNSETCYGHEVSRDELQVNECIKWWSNLLEAAENGGLPNLLSEEDHQTNQVQVNHSHSSVPNPDVDVWGPNLSIDEDGDDRQMLGNFKA